MGDLFDGGGLASESNLDDFQHDLLWPLSQFAQQQLKTPNPNLATLQSQLMRSTSGEARGLAERTWREGFVDPVVNQFKNTMLPAINSSFSRVGGTLSSRRDKAIADSLANVTSQASGQFAQMLPQIQAFPLQQTLAQIQGLGGLTEQAWAPFNYASAFATRGTRQAMQEPEGAGFGLIKSGISALGFGLGGGLGGATASSPGYTTYGWTGGADQISRVKGY